MIITIEHLIFRKPKKISTFAIKIKNLTAG